MQNIMILKYFRNLFHTHYCIIYLQTHSLFTNNFLHLNLCHELELIILFWRNHMVVLLVQGSCIAFLKIRCDLENNIYRYDDIRHN